MKNQFNSTEELVRNISENDSFKNEALEELKNRSISQFLFNTRNKSGLNQSEFASKAGCSKSKISKLENSKNDEISIKDLYMYASALDLQLEIGFHDKKTKIYDLIKYHAFKIKSYLDELYELAGDDELIQKGALHAHGEVWFNLTNMIFDNIEKMSIYKEYQKAENEIAIKTKEKVPV